MVFSQKEDGSLMRIGIDARMYNESGIGRYIRNLIDQLQKIDKENEYFVFLCPGDFTKLSFEENFHKIETDFKWYLVREQFKMPRVLYAYKLDLMHFPHFNVPIFYKGKYIVTIHDLIHQHFQMKRSTTHNLLVYKIKQFGYRKVFENAIKKSKKIITVSNFVKKQLKDEWGINDSKIDVTKEGVEENLLKIAKKIKQDEINKSLKKFNIKPPYIFYVGNAHPHKNIEGLVKTFLNIRKRYQYLQLVLSGNDNYFWQRVKKNYSNKDIIYTGYISDQELVALYKSAQVFVMPSFEEGFGIPLLEAFALDCSVVSSSAGSLSEIGGDAAIYFNPDEIDDMSEKISKVLNDQRLRKDLISKGEKRVKMFSWEKLAKQTLDLYMN